MCIRDRDKYRAQMEQLQAADAQIQAGKTLLNTQLAQADQQLKEQEAALEKAQQQFDSASKTALQSVNLDGMLDQSKLSSLLLAENFSMPRCV